ncbi:MAG: RNA-binding protein [Desulfobacteraceae bacterium 4572_35.2]|jgi:ribosome-associated protein|nr:MAG: RNA-binding protein [Desulfobacteraceae bacterium 4572_35.2]
MDFDLDGHEFIELNNLLKITGLCHSGGMAKMVIADGAVLVDGNTETRKRCKIRSGQTVTFEATDVTVR